MANVPVLVSWTVAYHLNWVPCPKEAKTHRKNGVGLSLVGWSMYVGVIVRDGFLPKASLFPKPSMDG